MFQGDIIAAINGLIDILRMMTLAVMQLHDIQQDSC